MNKLQSNPIRGLALTFIVAYALLLVMGNFVGGKELYRTGLQAVSAKIFQNWWPKAHVSFRPGTDPAKKGMDTMIQIVNLKELQFAQQNKTAVVAAKVYYNSYHRGFLLSIFFLSLAITVPLPWKRRLIAGGIGFLLVQGFILSRTGINIAFSMQENPEIGLVNSSEFMQTLVAGLDAFLVKNIVIAFIMPLLIWILVMFRAEDRELLRQLMPQIGKSKPID